MSGAYIHPTGALPFSPFQSCMLNFSWLSSYSVVHQILIGEGGGLLNQSLREYIPNSPWVCGLGGFQLYFDLNLSHPLFFSNVLQSHTLRLTAIHSHKTIFHSQSISLSHIFASSCAPTCPQHTTFMLGLMVSYPYQVHSHPILFQRTSFIQLLLQFSLSCVSIGI